MCLGMEGVPESSLPCNAVAYLVGSLPVRVGIAPLQELQKPRGFSVGDDGTSAQWCEVLLSSLQPAKLQVARIPQSSSHPQDPARSPCAIPCTGTTSKATCVAPAIRPLPLCKTI